MTIKISFGLPQKKYMDPTFPFIIMDKLPGMEEEPISYPNKYLRHAKTLDNTLLNHSLMPEI